MAFPKFLAPITVPTGGWVFAFDYGGAKTATIPAGTYTSILDLLDELATRLTAATPGSTWTVLVSSTGIVSIALDDGWTVTWASTTDALEAVLGFAGGEAVGGGDTLTATLRHQHGWYPGVISFGASDGAGTIEDSGWQADGGTERQHAGSARACLIGPARRRYLRTVKYGPLSAEECFDSQLRGPVSLLDRWSTLALLWYQDRTLGTVATPGSQTDPGAYEVDGDKAYWKVRLAKPASRQQSGGNPNWYTVELTLSAEPT